MRWIHMVGYSINLDNVSYVESNATSVEVWFIGTKRPMSIYGMTMEEWQDRVETAVIQ
jgi:hypothetical protein